MIRFMTLMALVIVAGCTSINQHRDRCPDPRSLALGGPEPSRLLSTLSGHARDAMIGTGQTIAGNPDSGSHEETRKHIKAGETDKYGQLQTDEAVCVNSKTETTWDFSIGEIGKSVYDSLVEE